jgi:hypothetical protein
MKLPLVIALWVVVVVGPWTAGAPARTYTVMSCKDRAGAAAPISDAAGGWVGGGTGGLGLDSFDACGEPGRGLLASVSGPWPHPVGSMAWWRFVAPPGTLVEGADVFHRGYARPYDGVNRGVIALRGAAAGELAHHWGEGPIAARWFSARGLHDAWIQATAQCDGPVGRPDCPAGTEHASIEVLRSEVLLSDPSPPDAGPASGSAVASGSWEGRQVFAFAATDAGSGVYQAIVSVDGAPVLASTIDDWGERCVDTTVGGRVFRYPQPCLTSVDALVVVDAAGLPVGDHEVALQVTDAAGNARTVYSARKTIGASRAGEVPPPSGGAASRAPAARLRARWVATSRVTLTAPYGRRNVIRGRVTSVAGAGIGGARVQLVSAIDGRPGARLDKGGARTRRDGRFTLILPADASSRILVLRYRGASRTLRLRVRAGVRLTVAPRTSARGRTIAIDGRLVGRPRPASGKVVELQARTARGRWSTFRTVRAARTGRFATRYTFHHSGPATYLLRARVREADDYPYATGSSRPVRVRVR